MAPGSHGPGRSNFAAEWCPHRNNTDLHEAVRKVFRIRMGRDPAEIAEGAEVYWEGGNGIYIGAVFNNCLGLLNRYH
ncbi:MAG: hypothetical protein ACOX52_16540 [Verrucomicrobiota bacterium]